MKYNNKYIYIKENVCLYQYPNNEYSAIIIDEDGKRRDLTIKKDAFKILMMFDGGRAYEEILDELNIYYNINQDKIEEFIDISISNGIIGLSDVSKKVDVKVVGDGKSLFPRHATIEITEQCNLKCTYCYNSASPSLTCHMPMDKIEKLFDLLSSNGVYTLEISGGEPMIHPSIYEILELAFRKFNWVAILSNGVYFPNNLLKLIKSNKDKFAGFQISIDGSNEEITYKLRQIKNTFSKSIDTIKKLIENDIFVRVVTVLTDDNIYDLRNMCELVRNIGVKHFGVTLVEEWGRANENIRKIIKTKYREEFDKVKSDYDDILDNYKILDKYKTTIKEINNCGAGGRSVTITPHGDVKACPTSSIYIGNIFTTDYFTLFNSDKVQILNNFSINKYKESVCVNCSEKSDCAICFSKMYCANKRRIAKGEGICEVLRDSGLYKLLNVM